jgi:hypothetical protein
LFEISELKIAELTEQQSFTIGMMLKSMNIDLDLIGYSMERQMWMG